MNKSSLPVEALDIALQDQIWVITGTFGGVSLLIALTLLVLVLKVAR